MLKYIPVFLFLVFTGCSSENNPSITLTENDNGKEILIKKEQILQLKLSGDGQPDCFWGLKKAPANVEFLTESKEGNTFEFNFKIKDSGPLTLEYVKFTENGVEKKTEFTINIKAE
jgi:predicted secreted protein